MDPRTLNTLIRSLPEILTALAGLVAAIGAVLIYLRTGKVIHLQKHAATQLQEAKAISAGNAVKLAEVQGAVTSPTLVVNNVPPDTGAGAGSRESGAGAEDAETRTK